MNQGQTVLAQIIVFNVLSRFTANRGPWELVFLEVFSSKSEALLREKAIKKLNRKSILFPN